MTMSKLNVEDRRLHKGNNFVYVESGIRRVVLALLGEAILMGKIFLLMFLLCVH